MAWRMAKLRRRKSGAWGARITIPKDVRPDYQTDYTKHVEEVFYAGPDCPPQRAQVLFSEWQAEIKNRIDTLRRKQRGEGHDLTQREARALAGEWYRWFVGQHNESPGKFSYWDDAYQALWNLLDWAAGDDETGTVNWRTPEARAKIHPAIVEEAKTAQFLTSKGEALTLAAMTMFLDEVVSELDAATTLLRRRAGGDYSEDQHLQTLPVYHRKAAPRSAPRSGKTAMQLFEGYIVAKKPADRTVRRWRTVFTTLDAYLASRDFDALSEDEAQEWVTALVTQKNQSPLTTMRIWVTALKAVGNWATKHKYVARNPFSECSVPVPKKTWHRETKAVFTTDEIKLILSTAFAIKNTKLPTQATRRWVPWICAYTGARGGEITQLRGEDIFERDGINALRITPEAGSTKTKEARAVPIHEHLIAQGFLDYVKTKGKGPLFYNPAPTATIATDTTNPKRSPAENARNGLSAWIRSIGLTDPEARPNHGWRHTFKNIADRRGISERVSDAITGHVPTTEGRAYGAPMLEDMAAALEKFPRYDIDDQPKQPRPAQAAPAPNNPRQSRATVGDTNARLHRN
jgi:integrase